MGGRSTDKANSLTEGGTDVKVKTNRKNKLCPDFSQRNKQTPFLSQATMGNRFIHKETIFIPQETRFIPQETKRKVFQQSGGCCEFVGENGK